MGCTCNIANDDKKKKKLATYDVFFALYNLLKPYHNGVPNIDHFFASMISLSSASYTNGRPC